MSHDEILADYEDLESADLLAVLNLEYTMPTMIQTLGIDRLSRDERLALVQQIWDTIAADQPPVLLDEALRQELDRRVSEDDATPDDVIPWETVEAQTLARFKKQ